MQQSKNLTQQTIIDLNVYFAVVIAIINYLRS